MPTLNEFIERGWAFYQGETVPKSEVAAQVASATVTMRDALTASQAEVEKLQGDVAALNAERISLKANLAQASAEVEELKKLAESLPAKASAQAATILAAAGVQAVDATDATPSADAGAQTFKAVVEGYVKAGQTKTQAVRSAIKSHPALYAAYRVVGGPL